MLLAALICVGVCYCYNVPNLLSGSLLAYFSTDLTTLSLSYTFHSVPALFGSLLTGALCDQVGTGAVLFILSLLTLAGGIVSYAASLAAVPAVTAFLAGRLIYGLGAEALLTAQAKLVATWFSQCGHLSVAFAFCYVGYMTGEFLAAATLSGISDRAGVSSALLAVVFALASGVAAVVISLAVDARRIAGRTCLPRSSAAPAPTHPHKGARAVLHTLKEFPVSFWLIALARILFFVTLTTWTNLGVAWMTAIDPTLSSEEAASTMSVLAAVAAATFLFAGAAADKLGYAPILSLGFVLQVVASILLGFFFTQVPPKLIFALAGASMGAVGSVSTSAVTATVGADNAGTGIGLTFTVQFMLLAGIVPGASWLSDHLDGGAETLLQWAVILPLIASAVLVATMISPHGRRALFRRRQPTPASEEEMTVVPLTPAAMPSESELAADVASPEIGQAGAVSK
jgi:MFS family permease